MTHPVAVCLVALGCAVTVLAVIGAMIVPGGVFVRLHFLTPITSVGVPLVAVGLCVENGNPFAVAEMLFIALLVAASGPVLESATGRVAAHNEGVVSGEQPQ